MVKRSSSENSGYLSLLLGLVFSSVGHGLVLAIPYAGSVRIQGGIARIAEESSIHRSAIKVSLKQRTRGGDTAAAKTKQLPPEFEKSLGAVGRREKKHGEESSVIPLPEGRRLLPFPGAAYYATKELTVRPQALGEPVLEVEEIAAIRVAGKIVLALWISPQGQVVNVSVERSNLPEIFTQTAVKAFREMVFSPGELNGVKVGAVMRVEVLYDDRLVPAD